MIENVIKRHLKNKTHVVEGMGMLITYKVNVNVKTKMNDYRRKFSYMSTPYSEYNIFTLEGRARRYDCADVRSAVRNDMNMWFAPMFSTYLYKDCYTRLCNNVQIRINTFTFR